MQTRQPVLYTFGIVLVAAVTATAFVRSTPLAEKAPAGNHVQQQGSGNANSGQSRADSRPIVDFDAPSVGNRIPPAARDAKNKRHDKWLDWVIRPSQCSEDAAISIVDDWYVELPAIPVAKSEIIALLRFQSADAYLSSNKHNIYTEFHGEVLNLFRNTLPINLQNGSEITVERLGGTIRFPGNCIVKYEVYGQNFPAIGHEYLLFLKRTPSGDDFLIITGYEIRNGTIAPLDGPFGEPGGGKFAQYSGVDADEFIEMIISAIQSTTSE
jgi:hypothetical protein